jgi:hypothetical protein
VTTIGSTFTRWRAESLGLDYRSAFERVCDLGLGLIRLAASWREIAEFGLAHLDWLMAHAEARGQPVLLTLGMKAPGWPEFHLPEGLEPGDPAVQRRALDHIAAVVRRYRDRSPMVAWQVENEPFNRSGPRSLWIPRRVVRREAQLVRSLDASRPLVITTFAHFDDGLDRSSSRHQSDWIRRLGLAVPAEREALAVLRPGDVLGTDVYRAIGWRDRDGAEQIGRAADDQVQWVSHWRRIAREQGKRFWVTEAQAEPWESKRLAEGDPLTVQPAGIADLVDRLVAAGVDTILLWGVEYWLWRQDHGDPRWVDTVKLRLRTLA